MRKCYRFNLDLNGTDSIQSYIDSGRIVDIPCETAEHFNTVVVEMMDTIKRGDGVIIDTMSALLETTRSDIMLGPGNKVNLWAEHGVYLGDKRTMTSYQAAQQISLRAYKNLRARGAHVIAVCHEKEGRDQLGMLDDIAVPRVNPSMVGELIGASSDVFRLNEMLADEYDGETLVARAGQRVLFLRRNEKFTAKFQVDPGRRDVSKIPKGMREPTFMKVVETLGKIPAALCLYGYSGAGKTTFAAGLADVLALPEEEISRLTAPRPARADSPTPANVSAKGK